MNRAKQCDLLILDDLGAEYATVWAGAMLGTLIDCRYECQKRTVFTTNVMPSALPPRIASRIQEGAVCAITGEDFRLLKARKRELKAKVGR